MATTHTSPYLLEKIELNEHGDVGGDQIYKLEIHKKYQKKVFDILSAQETVMSEEVSYKYEEFVDVVHIILAEPGVTFSPVDADILLSEIEHDVVYDEQSANY